MTLSHIRSFVFKCPMICLATIMMGSLSLLASLIDPRGRIQHRTACLWGRMLLLIGNVRMTVEGLEKISAPGCYVLAPNHLSYMDTPVILGSIPVEFRFLAKKSLFSIPFLGYHLYRAGHVAVPLGDARASLKAMTRAARLMRERGLSVLVFPEGGRSETGVLQEFKDGAAYLAIKAGAAVVPIGLIGTYEVLPMGSLHIRGRRVRLKIGDPIPTTGLTVRDRSRLTALMRERISELIAEPEPAVREISVE
jgi:1-acyl-sn-glycerol-3-phosphate acyltransferase